MQRPAGVARWVGILLLLATGAPGVFAQSTRLRAADTHDADYPTVRAVQWLADELERRTQGRLRLKIYSGGQLGEERDTLEITIFGGIDINRTSLAPLNSIVPETQVLSLPFLFRSTAHMRKVVDGPIGNEILRSLTAHGLIGLAFYDAGARNIYNVKRPIRTPQDLAGLKLRVMNSELFVSMVQALGANATPMSFGQVYEALALGTIDGAENNWPSFEATAHHEVAPHYSVTQHVMVPEVLVMSRYRWNKLGEDDQTVIRRVARESVGRMRQMWDARESAARKAMLASGVKVVERVDKAPFVRGMQPVYRRYLQDPKLRDLFNRIRAVE